MRPVSRRLAVIVLILITVAQVFATVPAMKGVGSNASDLASKLRERLQTLRDALSAAIRHLSQSSGGSSSAAAAPNAPPIGPQFIQSISLDSGTGRSEELRHPAYNPSNGMLYVPSSTEGQVYVINPLTNTLVQNITLGVVFPDDDSYVAYNPTNRYLYVTEGARGSIGIINGTSNAVVSSILANPVNRTYPQGIIVNPTNGNFYVAETGGVAAFNGTTNSLIKFISLPPTCSTTDPSCFVHAQDLAYSTANNRIFVTGRCAQFFNNTDSCMYVIDPTTNTLLTRFTIPYPCCTFDITYDPHNNSLYVTGGQNVTYLVNPSTNTFTGPITLAPAGIIPNPSGIAFDSANNFVYVAARHCGSLPDFTCAMYVINDSTNSVVATLPLERRADPVGVAIAVNNGKIYLVSSFLPFVYAISGVSAQAPSPPQNLQATTSLNQVTLTWTAPASSGGSAITGYNIYRSTTQGDEAPVAFGVRGLSYTDTVTVPGSQIFYYFVTAVNSFGEGYPSNEINITVNPDFTVSASPTALSGSQGNNSTSSTITLTSYNGFNSSVSLSVVFANTPSDVTAAFTPPTVTPTGISSLTFILNPTASPGSFNFYVQGIGGGLTHKSQQMTLTIAGIANVPSTPQGLQATGAVGYVNLTWSSPSSNGGTPITNYKIYRSISPGNEVLVATIGNQLTWTDNTIDEGATYYYRVTAVNYAGEGQKSNEASATPTEPSTPTLIVSIIGQGSVTGGFGETYNATVYSDGILVPNANITWTVTPSVGTPTNGTGSKFSWFAPVAGSGTVTLTATARARGYQQGTATFRVSYAPPPSTLQFVKVFPSTSDILFPGSQVYSATCYDEFGLAIPSCTISWSLSPASLGQLSASSGSSTTFTANNPITSGVPKFGVVTATGLYNANVRKGLASTSVTLPIVRTFNIVKRLSTENPQFNMPYNISISITNTGNVPQDFTVGLNQTSTSPSGDIGIDIPLPSFFTCNFGLQSRPINPLMNGNAIPTGTATRTVHLNPNQTAVIPFRVVDRWDWIPPWDVASAMCQFLWSIVSDGFLSKIVTNGDAQNALNAINSWGMAVPLLNYYSQVSVNGDLQPPFSTIVTVPIHKIIFLLADVLIGLKVDTESTFKAIVAALIGCFVTGVGCVTAAAEAALTFAWEALLYATLQPLYITAQDPDTSFSQVFVPKPVKLLNGTQFTNLPFAQSLPPKLRTLLANMANYVEFENATAISMDRYGSAMAAGDNRTALTQLRAAQVYAIVKDFYWANITRTLASGILSMGPTLDSSDIQLAQNYISTNGLPALERELLTGLGFSSQIPGITQSLLEYNYTYLRTTSMVVDSMRMQKYDQLELSALLNITVKQPPPPPDHTAIFHSSPPIPTPWGLIAFVALTALISPIPVATRTRLGFGNRKTSIRTRL